MEMPEVQGNGYFQIFEAISTDITSASTVGHRAPLLAMSQAQIRRLP